MDQSQKGPMNFYRPKKVPLEARVEEDIAMQDLLDTSLVAVRAAEEKTRYEGRAKSLGAGRIGHPLAAAPYERGCERALFYEMKQYPNERPFDGDLYRIFGMGHKAEEIVVENLRAAGFTVVTHRQLEDGTHAQIGFALAFDPETKQPRYKGFCDGVITAGPAEYKGVKLKYPMLWENKALKDKVWCKVRDEGVEKAKPEYYGQVQQYMNFLQLFSNPTFFTYMNRDTGELKVELIRFNQRHCQAIIERAARILEVKSPLQLERAAKDFQTLPCRWCSYAGQCRKDEDARTSAAGTGIAGVAPSWLNGGNK